MDQLSLVCVSSLGRIMCCICSKQFEKRGELNRHMKTHTKPHECDICNQGFALRTDLTRHRTKHASVNANFQCPRPDCNFAGTNRRDNLMRHMRRYHRTIGVEYGEAVKAQKIATKPASFLNAIASRKLDLVKMARERGGDILERTDEGKSAIHIAASCGDVAIVQYLLDIGLDGNLLDSKLSSAAHDAALNGHREVLQCFAENRISIISQDGDGYKPIYKAVYNDQERVVDMLLLEGNTQGELEELMVLAASKGHVEIVKLLFQRDVQVKLINQKTSSALWKAATNGYAEIVRQLLQHGAKVNQKNKLGFSALWKAAANGHEEVVGILLKHGAQTDLINYDGSSALYEAAANGHARVVQILLKHGADSKIGSVRTGAMPTPTYQACLNGHYEVVKLLLQHYGVDTDDSLKGFRIAAEKGRTEVVRVFLEAGVDPTSGPAASALESALQNGHVLVVKLLLEAGVKLSHKIATSAIDGAASSGSEAIVKLLLQAGVDPKSKEASSFLIEATTRGNEVIVEALLRVGVDVNRGVDGLTPLGYAVQPGRERIIEILLEARADPNVPVAGPQSKSALQYAEKKGLKGIVRLLRAAGARDDYHPEPYLSLSIRQNALLLEALVQDHIHWLTTRHPPSTIHFPPNQSTNQQ